MYTIKCNYDKVLCKEVEKYYPEIFKSELRVPDFYLNIVNKKLIKNQLVI